jgi:exopolyphosphatase/guanosine-5'-triphosphate,3'-diphosphate pyrophosphatase
MTTKDLVKFGAIDIGSNAVRLLIMSLSPEKGISSLKKELMLRVPLRLGIESFESGKITDTKKDQLIQLMKVYKQLLSLYEVADYRACATAAMREAKNNNKVILDVFEETKITIDIIDGDEEALIIYDSHFLYHLNEHSNYLFVDVGGGSTEVSLISNGVLMTSNSYKIGTVRMLLDKVDQYEYFRLHTDLKEIKEEYEIKEIIATGGNIIKLNSLANNKNGKKLSVAAIETIQEKLKVLSVEERMDAYKLKSDRADVITNAGEIYINIAHTVGAESFIVPKLGLIDGIILLLFERWKTKQSNISNFYRNQF